MKLETGLGENTAYDMPMCSNAAANTTPAAYNNMTRLHHQFLIVRGHLRQTTSPKEFVNVSTPNKFHLSDTL